MDKVERETLAVMFTDVVGFTSLMEQSETRALEVLGTIRDVQLPLLIAYRGNLIKEMGDGTLTTFPSPSHAVRCAREIQERLRGSAFQVRIGVHWGEVILKGDDVLGDPVNVASRVQALAPPGGICVSGELLRNYGPGRRPGTHPMGLRKLKGLGRLVDLFAVKGTKDDPLPVDGLSSEGGTERFRVSGDLPSIAVMPLENLGPDGDDFYAYSISSDLVSDLARAGRIVVTPLTDVLRLKKAVGASETVAARLRTRFMVTGTLWRRNERFQLSLELHDVQAGRLIWTDSWTEDWFELPSLKGKMADGLLKVLGLQPAGLQGVTDSETPRSEAYEEYLKARDLYWKKKDSADVERSLQLLLDATGQDPLLVPALNLLGTVYSEMGKYQEAEDVLRRACDAALEKGDRAGHLTGLNSTGINQWRRSDFRKARNTFLRTLRLARVLHDVGGEARSLSNIGLMESNMGYYARALDYLEKALKVSGPDDVSSVRANTLCNIGLTHWHMGDNTLALKYYRRALDLYEILEDRNGQAYIKRNIGIIMRSTGECQEGIRLTREAEEIYDQLGDRLGRCHCLNSMGNINIYLGQYSRARKDFLEALKIADQLDDRMTRGILMTNLGNIASTEGDHEEALRLHTESLEISRQLDDPEGEAENLTQIGEDLRAMGRLTESREALENSIELMEEMGAGARTVLTRAILAGVLIGIAGEEDSGSLALEQIEAVERIMTPTTSERTVTLWMISELYRILSSRHSGSEARRLGKRRVHCLREAHRSLMDAAGTLSDSSSRKSFLENIDDHRLIIEAFAELETKGKHRRG